MGAKYFETTEQLAAYQADRELQEALRVMSMSSMERFVWLKESWGQLQDSASSLFVDLQPQAGTARCYSSPDEKNRFDDDREIRRALQIQMVK